LTEEIQGRIKSSGQTANKGGNMNTRQISNHFAGGGEMVRLGSKHLRQLTITYRG
jgi:hypothetical protein